MNSYARRVSGKGQINRAVIWGRVIGYERDARRPSIFLFRDERGTNARSTCEFALIAQFPFRNYVPRSQTRSAEKKCPYFYKFFTST